MCRRLCTAIPITTGARCEHGPGDHGDLAVRGHGHGCRGGAEGAGTDVTSDAGEGAEGTGGETAAGGAEGTAAEGTESAGDDPAAAGTEDTGEDVAAEGADGTGDAKAEAAAPELSEAAAELLAQRLERERIERRKAEKGGPIAAGKKLSGTAADLLAAVRAVESGEKPVTTPSPSRTPPRAGPPRPKRYAARSPCQPTPAPPRPRPSSPYGGYWRRAAPRDARGAGRGGPRRRRRRPTPR